jgi:hypothetical protein
MNHDAGPWAALDVFMMKNPTRPAMIVTRRYDRLLAERAGERGAVCYELPVGEGVLARFAETAARVDTPGEAKVRAFVAAAIRAKGLGGSASRVLLAGLLGISTADLPGGAHLSADGIRSQEQSLRAAFNYEGKFQPLLVHLFREIFL